MAQAPNFKDKTVCVWDNGLFIELAIRLSKDFGKVRYYLPWKAAYPRSSLAIIGKGVEGIERVLDFWDIVDSTDLFVFPDVYDGDVQTYLRKNGKRVWGSGAGEDIELDRWGLKKLLKEIGLAVIHSERIVGLDALKKRLAQVESKFVKISKFRGDMETFHHLDYSTSLPWLDEVAHMVGPKHVNMEFILEDFIPGIEIGYDAYTIDGKYPAMSAFGYEIKDAGYVGKVKKYTDLPEPVRTVNEKLTPWLKAHGYRNFFSTEIRIGNNRIPYLTDPCARMGSPPGEVFIEMYKNLAEILWFGAEGTLIEPVMADQYAAELLITSEWGKTNWLEILFPKELRQWVKLRNLTNINGSNYVVPQTLTSEVGAVVAIAKTQEEAIKLVRQRADKLKGYMVTVDSGSLDKAVNAIAEGKKYGIGW